MTHAHQVALYFSLPALLPAGSLMSADHHDAGCEIASLTCWQQGWCLSQAASASMHVFLVSPSGAACLGDSMVLLLLVTFCMPARRRQRLMVLGMCGLWGFAARATTRFDCSSVFYSAGPLIAFTLFVHLLSHLCNHPRSREAGEWQRS